MSNKDREYLAICKQDCFHCPFADCVVQAPTPRDRIEINLRNWSGNETIDRHRAQSRAYYARNKERVKEYQRMYKARKKEGLSNAQQCNSYGTAHSQP